MVSSWPRVGRASRACCVHRSCRESSRIRRSSRGAAALPVMQPDPTSARAMTVRRMANLHKVDHDARARRQAVVKAHGEDIQGSPSATLHSRTAEGGGDSMVLLAFLLLAAPAPEGVAERVRHLASVASAWAPAPAPD